MWMISLSFLLAIQGQAGDTEERGSTGPGIREVCLTLSRQTGQWPRPSMSIGSGSVSRSPRLRFAPRGLTSASPAAQRGPLSLPGSHRTQGSRV